MPHCLVRVFLGLLESVCRWHPVLEAAATTGPLTDFNGSVRNKDLGENMAMLVQSMWSFKLEPIHTKTFLPLSLYKQQNKTKRSPTLDFVLSSLADLSTS